LLHDYGKIGVPDAILKKEGLLSPEEYSIVKTHAAKTREILSRINFEGIYGKVPEIAGSHHEKVNGTGYPDGLVGHEVPLGSRIIAVADYFEAITAKRHYREPMPIEEAFQALFDESGRSFDKRIVSAFLSYYSKANQYEPLNVDELERFAERSRARVSARLPLSFTLNGRKYTSNSEDISMRGVFVASDVEVLEGHPLELSITIPDISTVIEAKGRIAWVNSGQVKKTSISSGFGVEFLEYKDMAERFLEAFLGRYDDDSCAQECC
jgi:Tfp pilus assembly protein PilZ